jgi:predicted ATPase
MITRVAIKGYKSLSDVEVRFQPLTVIFGPNAVGKSNLFDVLGLLSRMVALPSLNQAFEQHRGSPLEAFHFGEGGLDSLLNKPTAEFTIEVDVQLNAEVINSVEYRIRQMREGLQDTEIDATRRRVLEPNLRYSLTVEILTGSGLLRVRNEELLALRRDGEPRRDRSPFIDRRMEAGRDRLVLRLEGQAHPTYYDIGMDHTLVSMPLYAPHYPHLTAFKEEVSRWRFYYLEPERMRADTPLKEVENLNHDGSDLAAFYNTLNARNPRQFQVINRALHRLLPRVDRFEIRRDNQGFLQLYVIEDGIAFSARSISEGTLRLLGLLAIMYALTPATVIGYEEPENGVHPRRIRLIADLLRNASSTGSSQVLVNTHSPLLPDDLADTYLLACRRKGHDTIFQHYQPTQLFKNMEIADYLDNQDESLFDVSSSIAEQILRGDFGG